LSNALIFGVIIVVVLVVLKRFVINQNASQSLIQGSFLKLPRSVKMGNYFVPSLMFFSSWGFF